MRKTNNNLTKAMIAVIAADTIITSIAAIRSTILVRKHQAEKQNHKPEVKMGHDVIGEFLPMLIPGNSPSFAEKAIKAFCDECGIKPDENKIKESTKEAYWDFWYGAHEDDKEIIIYCKDEKTIKFEFKNGYTSELEITIISDGENEDDKVVRTKITKANYSKGNNEYYSRSYDHCSLEEALQVPEFRFLQEAFSFKIVPSVEYNN